MKRYFHRFFLAIFSFVSVSAFSVSPKDFSLSVEPLFGMKWGQVDEYVFQKDSNDDYQKLSELNWPIKNMFQYGANIDGGYKHLKTQIHFSALIPADSGIMEDSDWMGLDDMKTNYSKSENTITQSFDFSVLLKYDFQPIAPLKIGPTIGFEYKTISFEARNGYGWYGDSGDSRDRKNHNWYDEEAKYIASGGLFGVDYKRDVKQFWLGYYFEYTPIKKIRMFEAFSISPYTYTASYDTHYSNVNSTDGVDYADEVRFFFTRIKYSTGCYYILNDQWEFGLHISAFNAFRRLGTNYQKDHNKKTYSNKTDEVGVKGGAAAWEIDATLSCRFKIF